MSPCQVLHGSISDRLRGGEAEAVTPGSVGGALACKCAEKGGCFIDVQQGLENILAKDHSMIDPVMPVPAACQVTPRLYLGAIAWSPVSGGLYVGLSSTSGPDRNEPQSFQLLPERPERVLFVFKEVACLNRNVAGTQRLFCIVA